MILTIKNGIVDSKIDKAKVSEIIIDMGEIPPPSIIESYARIESIVIKNLDLNLIDLNFRNPLLKSLSIINVNCKSNRIRFPIQISRLSIIDVKNLDLIGALDNIKNLIFFHIKNTKIDFLPKILGGKLKTISIENCDLLTFPSLEEHKEVEYLYFPNNKIRFVPESVNCLTKTKTLALGANNIESINLFLPNLELLYLSNNSIINYTDIIINSRKIKELYIGGNNIAYIPDSIYKFQFLKELDLSNLNLEYLSDKIMDLPVLDFIDVEGSTIKCSDKLFSFLKRISYGLFKRNI